MMVMIMLMSMIAGTANVRGPICLLVRTNIISSRRSKSRDKMSSSRKPCSCASGFSLARSLSLSLSSSLSSSLSVSLCLTLILFIHFFICVCVCVCVCYFSEYITSARG